MWGPIARSIWHRREERRTSCGDAVDLGCIPRMVKSLAKSALVQRDHRIAISGLSGINGSREVPNGLYSVMTQRSRVLLIMGTVLLLSLSLAPSASTETGAVVYKASRNGFWIQLRVKVNAITVGRAGARVHCRDSTGSSEVRNSTCREPHPGVMNPGTRRPPRRSASSSPLLGCSAARTRRS